VVQLLVGVQAFIKVVLALGVCPEHVPVVAISAHQVVQFEEEADQLGLALQHLVLYKIVLR